ncbi:hypothetical protein K2V03_002141 [Listeria innocua]|nr:hypothetical protein [Listeria innocua]EIU0523731.1 hypothetical protein [Listeria innocua]
MKKRVQFMILAIIMSLVFGNSYFSKPVHADESNSFLTTNGNEGREIILENPEEFNIVDDISFENSDPRISVRYIDYNATVYEPSTKSSSTTIKYRSEVRNSSSTNDKVERSVKRDKFVKAGASTSAEFKLVTAKVGVKAEIGFGKSDSVTTTYTWTIPKHTVTTIKFGSKVYNTSGNIVRYNRGKVTNKKPVSPKYTYGEYSSKTSKKIK